MTGLKTIASAAAALCALALPAVPTAPAQGQEIRAQATYRVVGVAPDDTLNVRARPSPRAPVVGRLGANAGGIVASGRTARVGRGLWAEITAGALRGWVNARYLGAAGADPSAPPASGPLRVVDVAADDTLNMRAGPGAGHSLIGRIPPDARGITATGQHTRVGRTDWWVVRYGGREGWVAARYLAPDTAVPPPETRVPAAPLPEAAEAPVESEGPRVALVIGNGAYRPDSRIPGLPNPPNDGRDMAEALRGVGFKVIEVIDGDLAAMQRALSQFGDWAAGARIALVFYAGHGMQANGENYLLPVSASLAHAEDLTEQSLSLSAMMRTLEQARPSLGLVILDACRNNPMAGELARDAATRGLTRVKIGKGLARHKGAPGTLIAYSTDPDNVAVDGEGRNSPFTAALLEHMKEPELEIRLMFGNVREAVSKATGGRQTPWVEEAVLGRYYFRPPPKIRTSRFHGTWIAEHYTLAVDEKEVRIERPPYVGEPARVLAPGSAECGDHFEKDYSVIAPDEIRTRLTDPQIKDWAEKMAKGRSLLLMKIVCGYRTHIFYLLLADYQQLLLAEFSEMDYLMREGFYKPPN